MVSLIERAFADAARARRTCLAVALILTALRAGFAAALPFTSDEAYFLSWGRNPAWGFYDHPPMIGWWLAALDAVSGHRFVLRLPALVAPLMVAATGWWLLRRYGEALAWAGATLLLLVPLNAWNVAITTDIPLMLFSALAVALYLRARATGRAADFLLAGLALAGALMSKYFAGLLAIAIFLHSVWRPTRASLTGLAWVVVGALPAALVQIAWNAWNCWPNVMFNLVNRHGDAGLSWETPALYLMSVLYVLTPAVALRLFGFTGRERGGRAQPAHGVPGERAGPPAGAGAGDVASERAALRWLAIVPLAIFAALSLVKTIGLHWLASFVLPAVLWFALSASARSMARALAVAALIAIAHWLLIGALAALPTETFRAWKGYQGLVLTVHTDELAQALAPWRGSHVIASDGYSPAVTLAYALGEHVVVFGPGTSHARHDDILTDFRALDGRDILVVRRRDAAPGQYEPWFEQVTLHRVEIRGAHFNLIEGRGFRYGAYRDDVLDDVRERYYAVPDWLPRGPCYFCDRYFPDRACHR
jgi:4-amino-4-deoxy-L-arabinose transferase-like glycosyltransferase